MVLTTLAVAVVQITVALPLKAVLVVQVVGVMDTTEQQLQLRELLIQAVVVVVVVKIKHLRLADLE
jgi:hypothetical protein